MKPMKTYVFQPWQYQGLVLMSGAIHLCLVSAVAFIVPDIDPGQFLQGLLFIAVLEILIVMHLRKKYAEKPQPKKPEQEEKGPSV